RKSEDGKEIGQVISCNRMEVNEKCTREKFLAWADSTPEHSIREGTNFFNCSLIPNSKTLDAITSALLPATEASSVVSIGSGAALLEWLLADRIPGTVTCIDACYNDPAMYEKCVFPPVVPLVRAALSKSSVTLPAD